MLIKSFEGFRPRAIQRAEGGWIIGYGHTLSAREGATVSEADAELLLRYDLLPVEKTVNDLVPATLNQHQFDALVSFALSVGVDRFAGSDVRQRLAAGAPGEAADAIMGWPEPVLPETALRRRAAERALFVANPDAPVALSDLLGAPLPPPPVVVPFQTPPVEAPASVPAAAESTPTPEPEAAAEVDPRGAAVAALLGEPPARIVQEDTPEVFDEAPVANDNPPAEIAEDVAPPVEVVPDSDDGAEIAPETLEQPASSDVSVDPTEETRPAAESAAVAGDEAPASETAVEPEPVPSASANPALGWAATRYAPYGMAMVGPLPFLSQAEPREDPTTTETAVDQPAVDVTPTSEPDQAQESVAELEPAEPISSEVVIQAEPVPAAAEAAVVEPDPVPAEAETAVQAEVTSVEPMAYVAPADPAPVTELVLTPLEETPEPAVIRPLWTAEERDAPDGSETNLFGEDLTLTMGGGSIMRHEIEMEAPARFDWSETGPFIFMGGVGLVSFGASMAAFRRAAEQSGGSELTIIGWVLALIGLACVGVSSVNLYRKFGLPGGD